jgi:Fic family protein
MKELVNWLNDPSTSNITPPLKAGIFMYQFLTIHPYMDGNGRVARAIATYILRRGGYGLKGLFVLEKYYDRNLKGYYNNLQMGLHHNFYFGRKDANITSWLEFFLSGLAEVFQEAAEIVKERSIEFMAVEPKLLRNLDIYQRSIFAQLAFKFNYLTTTDLRRLTGFADRTVRDKVKKWISSEFIKPNDPGAKRVRAITLTDKYRKIAEKIAENPDRYKYLLLQ